MKYRDRMETPLITAIGRHDSIPRPHTLFVREKLNDDGTWSVVRKQKLYGSVVSSDCIFVNEAI